MGRRPQRPRPHHYQDQTPHVVDLDPASFAILAAHAQQAASSRDGFVFSDDGGDTAWKATAGHQAEREVRGQTMDVVGPIDELGYTVPEANRIQRLVWKVSSSRPGARLLARTLHHIDRLVLRLTRQRLTVPGALAGLPVITLATTSAQSRQRREVPLSACLWRSHRRPQHPVRPVPNEADGVEREAVWTPGCQIYAGYQAYARRIDQTPDPRDGPRTPSAD